MVVKERGNLSLLQLRVQRWIDPRAKLHPRWSPSNTRTHTHTREAPNTHTLTNQEGALGVEGVGATHVDASVTQKLQQTHVVVTVHLQGETNTQKYSDSEAQRLIYFILH